MSAAELPSFELVDLETPTWVNPLGAKGIGESGTIGSTPAVQNAVCDALAHLGVRHIDMPCTPRTGVAGDPRRPPTEESCPRKGVTARVVWRRSHAGRGHADVRGGPP